MTYEQLQTLRKALVKVGDCIEKYERHHENYQALRNKLEVCRCYIEDIYNGQYDTSNLLPVGLAFNGLAVMSCDESFNTWKDELDDAMKAIDPSIVAAS